MSKPMTKTQLVAALAEKMGTDKKSAALVHDKGTLFGLRTNGRIESILMSLPPHVQWQYNHSPEVDSDEDKLLQTLKKPQEWI